MTRRRWIPGAIAAAVVSAAVTAPAATAATTATVTVSGTVRDGSGQGWPLWSKVSVDGAPITTNSSPWDGRYQLQLDAGQTYTLRFQPMADGYPAVTRQVEVDSDGTAVDVDVPVDGAGCYAPGYRHKSVGVAERFDATTPPAGWTIEDPLGEGQVWRFDDPGKKGNHTGGRGGFAILDGEYFNIPFRQDTSLVSPVLDLTDVAEPSVGFLSDFTMWDYTEPSGIGEVDVSLDGGAAWETVWHLDTPRSGPDTVTVPIPQAAGHSNVRVRFRYREGELTAGRWWAIDDVYVGTRTCDPVPGGLVAGVLTDRNTGLPVVGGTVRGPGGASTASIATPTDDALAEGYYSLFVPQPGPSELTAGRAKYQSQTSTVTLTDKQSHRADFSLAASRIETVAASVTTEQELGKATTKTLTLRNTGTADATVGLTERPGGFDLLGDTDSAGAPVQRVEGTYSPYAEKAAGKRSAAPSMATATTGTAWTGAADLPMSIASSSAAAIDGRIYSVGGDSGITDALAETFRYDPATTSWSELARMPHPRQKPAVAVLDGRLHVTGGWGLSGFLGYPGDPEPAMDIYDPATNEWTSGPATPAPVAAAGTAALDGSMYVVGGCTGPEVCGTQAAYRYKPGATGWERLADYPEEVAWLNCGGIEGVLYCAGGMRPGPIVQVLSLKTAYSYDPGTNTWTRRADLPMELWASASTVADGKLLVSTGVTDGSRVATNQGFGYDPRTDSWSALPNATYASFRSAGACGFYKIGGATPYNIDTSFVEVLGGRTDCASDRDSAWLSAAPSSAITVRPGQETQVTVRFDAGAVSQPGTYTADLVIRGDTPYAPVDVNAEMLVNAPRRWGKLTGTVTGASCDGTVAPLPGATVWLHGRTDEFTIPTDADGRYIRWLDSANSPATVVVGLDGWTPQTTKIKLSGGRTTTLDVKIGRASCRERV